MKGRDFRSSRSGGAAGRPGPLRARGLGHVATRPGANRRSTSWPRARAFRAVDALVQNINSMLGAAGNMYGDGKGPINGVDAPSGTVEDEDGGESILDTTGYKRVVIGIKLRERVVVEDAVAKPEKFAELYEGSKSKITESLQAYLGLPLEQYSVLNPDWIVKGEEEGAFLLKVPLNEIVGLQLQPSLKAQVQSSQALSVGGNASAGEAGARTMNPAQRLARKQAKEPSAQVVIYGKEAKMGSKIFDELVDITFTLKVAQERSRRDRKKGGQRDDSSRNKTILKGLLVLQVEVNVPTPLSKLPRRVLKSTGGTLIRLVMQRMLKGFLSLLVRDYETWGYHETRGDDSRGETTQ